MNEATEAQRQAALDFLETHKTGVLATIAMTGDKPHARTIYFTYDEHFNLYFLTMANTRKAEDLHKNGHAAFVVSSTDVPQTLQMEGEVTDITNHEVDNPIITNLFTKLTSNNEYFAPVARLDRGDIRFYKFMPTWIRWGDFTDGHGTDKVLFSISPDA